MNYPIAFSKRWFLLAALLLHLSIFIIALRLPSFIPPLSHTPQPIIISLPTNNEQKLNLQAGLRAGANSFNPNPEAQSQQEVPPDKNKNNQLSTSQANNHETKEAPLANKQKDNEPLTSQLKNPTIQERFSTNKQHGSNKTSVTSKHKSLDLKKDTNHAIAPSFGKQKIKKIVEIAHSNKPYDPTANGGYVYSRSAGGTALINKPGSLSVPPTVHDTIYANYLVKMLWHLQATARHMMAFNFLLKSISGIKTARIRVVIARDGTLLETSIVNSTGNPELDSMMLKAITTAHPYPPLPNYFPSNSFVFDGELSVEGLK